MAESFVFDVADSLIGKLTSYAYEEVSRAYGAYEDLQGIKNTLSIVRGLLLDAEEKKNKQHALREWLRQIHNICSDAEDILDGFELQDKRKQFVEASGSTQMKVRHFFSSFNPLSFRLKMARQIKEIRDRLNKAAADGTGFGLVRMDVEPRLTMQRRNFTHSHVDASSVIGRENDKEAIIKLLMESNPRGDCDKCPCVIPIVGIGGLGKTTLAKLVFNDKRIDEVFPLKIWDGEEIVHSNLVEIGKEIVRKCAGVPLAVKTLGSSLFSKFDLNKWIFVRDHEIWNLEQKKDDILPALKLSYDEMPSYLRQCFAYFSLFPKNHSILVLEITSLWIALGLVQSNNGSEKLEHIAKEYIQELHSRSLLLDFHDFGDHSSFKVHDLINDLAMYVAKEEFVTVVSHTRNVSEQARHLSIIENDSLDRVLFPKSKSVRTIMFPIKGVGLDNETLLHTWISRYKYLRLLDLSDSSFETLPNSISELEHLRFLSLSYNKKIKKLAHSIFKFHNLQVLALHGCTELETLPRGLGKMTSLRYLLITTKQSVLSLTEFVNLNQLQVLAFLDCNNMKFEFNGSQNLTSIEILVVFSCGSLESLPLHIFPKLRSLRIADCKMLNLSLNNESPIQKLMMKHLYIGYFPRILTLPGWIEGAAETLETFVISDLPNFHTLPECLTTMTHLKNLEIIGCPNLLSLPSDIHHLTALEYLRIVGCPKLCRKCKPQSGEYWPMIAHIKSVFIEEGDEEEEE